MKTNVWVAVTLGLALLSTSVHAEPLTDAYTAATTEEKLVFCAPILIKQGGILQIIADRLQDEGQESKSKETRNASFNVGYRGETLQTIAKSTQPGLLDKFWNLSADLQSRESYSEITGSCVRLYNEQRKTGHISIDIEKRAIAKVRREYDAKVAKPSITPECRSNKAPYEDLCKMSRAIAVETAKQLPMRLNKNLTLMTVLSEWKRVGITAALAYDRNYLDSVATENGVSLQTLRTAMITSAKTGICSGGDITEFINKGGSVQYMYRFMDGTSYMNVDVDNCH